MTNDLRARGKCTNSDEIDEIQEVISRSLQLLSCRCDGANALDGVGFNRFHSNRGHHLATVSGRGELSREEYLEAFRLLQSYQKTQLSQHEISLPTEVEFRAWLRDRFCEEYKPVKRSSATPTQAQQEPVQSSREILPGIIPNAQQRQALANLQAFADGDERLYLLTGAAGCGKSVVIQAFLQQLRDRGDTRSVVFTAFSNKATKVLQKMVDRWNLNVECITCCKLLGLKPEIDHQTGKQYFVVDRSNDEGSRIENFDLVVVDESSMISEEMWRLLVDATVSFFTKTKLLFVGDPAQLPPVGERESKCFSEIHYSSHLTEVVRYGGAIGVLAESIRQRIDYKALPEFQNDMNADRTEGILAMDRSAWEGAILNAFRSQSSKNDPDYVRVLAYTNKRVSDLNQKIRACLYGESAERFVVGERLMAMSPVIKDKSVVIATSSEMEVKSIQQGVTGGWKVWCLEVEADEGRRLIQILHEEESVRFEAELKALAESKRWREYWKLKQVFADVNYAYCLTIHKSQGSTFQNVFVDVQNCCVNQKIKERNQLLYVAVTRAAKRVFVYQG